MFATHRQAYAPLRRLTLSGPKAEQLRERIHAKRHYGDYQMEIYLDGLHGKLPRFPVDRESLEAAAVEVLPSWVYSYVGYGAGDGRTQQGNVDAFGRYAIVPRMLVAPTERDLSVSLFDMQLPTPLFMPPVGVVGVCSQGHARRYRGGQSLCDNWSSDGGLDVDAGPDGRCPPALR